MGILAAGLAHALQDIHAAGLIHRDLKPSNVLVTIDGPRVIDFGIARALETLAGVGLTRTGALVGSPGFMAPEQVRGDRITPACDVFCLGSVLAYAATGTLPFGDANSAAHALMFRIAQEDPDLEGLPEGLDDLVRDCLRKDPGGPAHARRDPGAVGCRGHGLRRPEQGPLAARRAGRATRPPRGTAAGHGGPGGGDAGHRHGAGDGSRRHHGAGRGRGALRPRSAPRRRCRRAGGRDGRRRRGGPPGARSRGWRAAGGHGGR